MVVLTLHRDEPLSVDEIALLPSGCYPVFATGDVVARAELSLPAAHTARFAAEMARAVPDAEFTAEERPTAYAVALLEAGELEDPYWAHVPPMTFRVDPPGAGTLAEGRGSVDDDSPLREEAHALLQVQQPQAEPAGRSEDITPVHSGLERSQGPEPTAATQPAPPPPLMKKTSLDSLVQQMRSHGAGRSESSPVSEEQPSRHAASSPVTQPMSLDSLVQQMRADGVRTASAPQPAPAESPAVNVPSHIMEMFNSIRQQERSTGQALHVIGGSVSSTLPAPPASPRTVAEDPSAPAEPGFWDHVDAGNLEKAEEAARREGLAIPNKERILTMVMDKDPARAILGLRVSKAIRWTAAGHVLGRLVHHPDSEVRRELVQALRVLAPPDAEADLVVLTRDNELSVSDAARAALRRMKKRSRF